MSRPFVAAVAALGLGLTLVAPAPASAGAPRTVAPPAERPGTAAQRVLDRATEVLEGDEGSTPASPTLVLRDLVVARPALDAAQRELADALLARPTQGANDPNGDGYTVRSRRTCSTRICVHWVPRTADAPPNRAWVDRTMAVLERTWSVEVGELGYRRPLRDGTRGGNSKFDVYLKDVGGEGYYGYCAPERSAPDDRWTKSGYCVLDDDFARAQFGTPPGHSLRVTAAHEFFHAVQFAYDYAEDGWLMESSATWMEERVADEINDNRQYLRYGQVAQPARSLDLFRGQSGFNQYGNWAFLEYLSQRFGNPVVRRIWSNASGSWRNHSIWAVRASLPSTQTFAAVFRAYAAANTMPALSYSEGDTWPRPTIAARHELGPGARAAGAFRIDHLAARHVVVRPADDLAGRAWRLRVRVNGPVRATSPTAYVLVHRADGSVGRTAVPLDGQGNGSISLRFDSVRVHRASITFANASTRYDCWERNWSYACQGVPRDQDKRYEYRVSMFRR